MNDSFSYGQQFEQTLQDIQMFIEKYNARILLNNDLGPFLGLEPYKNNNLWLNKYCRYKLYLAAYELATLKLIPAGQQTHIQIFWHEIDKLALEFWDELKQELEPEQADNAQAAPIGVDEPGPVEPETTGTQQKNQTGDLPDEHKMKSLYPSYSQKTAIRILGVLKEAYQKSQKSDDYVRYDYKTIGNLCHLGSSTVGHYIRALRSELSEWNGVPLP